MSVKNLFDQFRAEIDWIRSLSSEAINNYLRFVNLGAIKNIDLLKKPLRFFLI